MDSKAWALGLGLIAIAFGGTGTEAHKAVTSRYNYSKDVFPVLSAHCGACHRSGGPAPMSLLNYKDAVAWAEAVRDELTAERMPPFPVAVNGPAIKAPHPMSAHDIDVVVTWASGGTPYGDPDVDVPAEEWEPGWPLETPDLEVRMAAAHTVAAGTLDETCDFTLPTGLTEMRWVRAADLMPGTDTLVRDAIISVENGPVLALWQPPGNDTQSAPTGTAFKLPAGAKLHLKIHYKKHFDAEQDAVSDLSTIGLYFTDPPASGREIQSIAVNGAGSTTTVAGPARVVALRPSLDRAYSSVAVDAVSPAGDRVPLLRLNGPRPQWARRYWLQNPIEIAGGSRIEVSLTPLPSSVDEPKTAVAPPLQIALDYIPE